MHTVRLLVVLLLSVAVIVTAGCPRQQPDGGMQDSGQDRSGDDNGSGGADDDDVVDAGDGSAAEGQAAARAPRAVPGFLRSDEVWFLGGSGNLISAGVGDLLEFAFVSDSSLTATALGIEPSGAIVRYSGDMLSVRANFRDRVTGELAHLDIAAEADQCAAVIPGEPCGLQGDGVAQIGEVGVRWSDMVFFSLDVCDDPPTDLGDQDEWAVFNVHPLVLPLLGDPNEVGAAVALGGELGQFQQGAVFTGLDPDGNPLGCLDESPAGSVQWDGTTLRIDTRLGGQDNADGVGSPGSCTVRFTGKRTYCAFLDPAVTGSSASAGTIIRVDGRGSYSAQDGEGEFRTLYLVFGEGSASLPGGGVKR